MSNQITTAMVKQYSANVFHLVQQKGSRLAEYVRRETQNSEESFYDRIGAVDAMKKTSRHSDVVFGEVPHSRRRVVTEDYYFADLVDKEDKLRLIISPESEYAIAARNALGRAMDDIIIASALGSAYAGKDGAVAVPLPDTQILVAHDNSDTLGSALNVKTLRSIKKRFMANEADEEEICMAVAAEQIDNMLGDDQITNSDYAAIKALVQGDVDTFMGIKFIRTERLPETTAATTFNIFDGTIGAGTGSLAPGARRCFAWQRMGVLLSTAAEVMGRIDERADKHYANQVYASMSMGGTRMEEERVIEVRIKE